MAESVEDMPVYKQIRRCIAERIERGDYPTGSMIPSENELAEEFGTTRLTIRSAMDELVKSGQIRRVQGKGAFVAGSFIRSKNHRFYRTHTAFDAPEPERRCAFLRAEVEPGQDFICRYLRLATGTPLLRLERLISIEDRPFVLVHSYFEEARFPGLAQADPRRFEQEALTLIIENDYATPTMAAHELGSAVSATPEVAAALQLPESAPVLFLEMLSFSYDESPYEYRQSFCVSGRKLFRSY